MSELISNAASAIRSRSAVVPKFGVILGSGLGPLAEHVEEATVFDYAEIPGFPVPTVGGHSGRLLIGSLSGQSVAVLQGRAHYYETGDARAMNVPVMTLAALGCDTLIVSNASGAIPDHINPGDVVLISDHINWPGISPLIGETAISDPFIDMTDAYDPTLRQLLKKTAKNQNILVSEGVYTYLAGPQFETPAEIRAVRALGGDLVGMSTVPEVILARRLGMRVLALSVVTNRAAGLSDTTLSHGQTQEIAKKAEKTMRLLVSELIYSLGKRGS